MASVSASSIQDDDVLFGRGGGTNKHPGNMRFRDMIDTHRAEYQSAERQDKLKIAGKIIRAIRYGEKKGRFLRKDETGWYEVGNDEAMRKASAALREKSKWSSLKSPEAAAGGAATPTKKAPEKPKAKKAKKAAKSPPVKSSEGTGVTPKESDVLFGRGGGTNRHPGNLFYRDLINSKRKEYTAAGWDEKVKIAGKIVEDIRTGDRRFLRKDDDGIWYSVTDDDAARKVLSALREKSKWAGMTPEKKKTDASEEASVDFLTKKKAAKSTPAAKRTAEASSETPDAKRVKSEAVPTPTHYLMPPEQVAAVNAFGLNVSNIVIPPLVRKGNPKPPAKTSSTVVLPNEEDVLLGRGGGTNHNPGNKRMRATVAIYRDLYTQAKREDKKGISAVVVAALRSANPPSRFLQPNAETGLYEEVDDRKAAQKISQLMREKQEKQPEVDI